MYRQTISHEIKRKYAEGYFFGVDSRNERRVGLVEGVCKNQRRRESFQQAKLDVPIATRRGLGVGHIVDMIAKSHKQVEEEWAATVEHLELHGAAARESGAAADDEGEVVSTQLGVGVGRV